MKLTKLCPFSDPSQPPRSPPALHNENSNPDGSNQGGTMGKDGNEEASGLDKLLTLFPSTPQAGKPGGTGKDEDTASEADYKCNEIKVTKNAAHYYTM